MGATVNQRKVAYDVPLATPNIGYPGRFNGL
jgi:hypothetical protein